MTDMTAGVTGIRLEGAPNFRDIGGWTGHDGRAVRHGLLFRSDRLNGLTAGDFARLRQIGIGLVCDLRSAAERRHQPMVWPGDFRPDVLDLDINVDVRAANDAILDILRADPTARGATAMMMESYRVIPLALQRYMADLFRRLADERSGALLFHCTAGKDRTGVMAALLLLALGVSRQDVMTDYLLTRAYADIERTRMGVAEVTSHLLGRPAPDDVVDAMTFVQEDYLNRMFASIEGNAGSIDGYLAAAGIDDTLMERVRNRLLHPA